MGHIKSVNVSHRKGEAKRPVASGALREDWGVEGDVHAGLAERQVSLLAWEAVLTQIAALREKGVDCPKTAALSPHSSGSSDNELRPGDYAENITTEGIDLKPFQPGDRLLVGSAALLEVTRIGKECHRHCEIFERLGDCVMPREGVFAKVLRGGTISAGDEVRRAARSDSDTE